MKWKDRIKPFGVFEENTPLAHFTNNVLFAEQMNTFWWGWQPGICRTLSLGPGSKAWLCPLAAPHPRQVTGTSLSLGCIHTQSYPTLCHPMDYSPPGSSVHGISPGKNTGVGCHFLLQGIFSSRDQTHVSHISWIGRQILYH